MDFFFLFFLPLKKSLHGGRRQKRLAEGLLRYQATTCRLYVQIIKRHQRRFRWHNLCHHISSQLGCVEVKVCRKMYCTYVSLGILARHRFARLVFLHKLHNKLAAFCHRANHTAGNAVGNFHHHHHHHHKRHNLSPAVLRMYGKGFKLMNYKLNLGNTGRSGLGRTRVRFTRTFFMHQLCTKEDNYFLLLFFL